MGHEFELAAACEQEKDVWMTAIRESLLFPTSDWIQEPISSLKVDGRGELIPSGLDGPFEAITSLPTIQSVSSLTKDDVGAEQTSPETVTTFPPSSIHPPRRSSSTSTRAAFTPMSTDSDTVIIRRPLLSSRTTVDQGLHDVVSELCLSARSQAVSREQELFQLPHVTQLGSASRSSTSSELTKSRLKRHESVRVSRCKSFIDSDETRHGLREAIRTRSLSARKAPKKLSIASANANGIPFLFSQSPTSTPPFSRPSSIAPTSNPNSRSSSPTERFHLATPIDEPDYHSRPRSFVGNVRGLVSRPPSPASRSSTLAMTPVTAPNGDQFTIKNSASRLFKRWVKGSSTHPHRRTHSAPDNKLPVEQGREGSPVLPELPGFGAPLQLTKSPEQAVALA